MNTNTSENKDFVPHELPKLFHKEHIRDPKKLPHQHLVDDFFHVTQIGKEHSASFFERINKKYESMKLKYIHMSKKSPVKSYLAMTALMIFGIALFDTSGGLFKASLTDNIPAFDGTTYPFEKSPSWFKTGGKNTRLFSDYSASELTPAPRYNAKLMQQEKWAKDIVDPKITYSIVYMGQYKYNHIENKGSHPGVDIKLPKGTPVLSIANGVVVKALEKTTGYGKHVVIKHVGVPQYGTLYSSYSHMSKLNVKVGQIIKKGQKIGEVGSTGNSTTAHIHFQVDRANAPFHPYWPFAWKEVQKAGVSYTEAVNIGLGREKGLKYTVNPFTFIHAYQKGYSKSGTKTVTKAPTKNTPEKLHSAPVKKPEISQKPAIKKEFEAKSVLDNFSIKASPEKILEGDSVVLTIIAQTDSDNKIRDFNEDVELTYRDGSISKKVLIPMRQGLAKKTLTFNHAGRINIRVKFENTFKSTSVLVKKRPVVKAVSSDTTKNPNSGVTENFDHFKISGEKAVKEGESIVLTVRALDKNGNGIASDNFPRKGAYAISVKNGVVSPNRIAKGDFATGEFVFRVKGKKRGPAWVKIGDTKFDITVLQKIAPQSMVDDQNTKISASEEKTITHTGTKIFSDVYSSHKNAQAINYLKAHNIVNGYADGSFKPEKTVTRSEAIKMIFAAFDIQEEKDIDSPFKDVSSADWFSPYILAAYDLNIVNGYADGNFKPAKTVNRSEYFKIFLNSGDVVLPKTARTNPFSDTEKTTWFAPYAEFAKKEKLLDFSGNKFSPTKEITRAEVAETIYRFLK